MNELTKQNISNEYLKKTNKKLIQTSSVKYGQVNRPYKKWIQKKPFMVSCITTLIIFVLVVGSSVRVLKVAAFKRFSVRPCWSPILLKLQNSDISGVFQCIFKKISEHVFYRTTMNCYFGTKKGRCKYWSIVLFESGITSEKTKVQIL